GFSPRLLDPERFDKTSNLGAFAHIVSGEANIDVFGGKVIDSAKHLIGGSASGTLGSGLTASVAAVRLGVTDGRTGAALTSSARLNGLSYDLEVVTDVEEQAAIVDFVADIPIDRSNLQITASKIDYVWSMDERLPFAAKVLTQEQAIADDKAP